MISSKARSSAHPLKEADAIRRVSILGSTGSIGCSTLDVIAQNPNAYAIEVLSAGSNADKLIEQALTFAPRHVVIADERAYSKVKDALSGKDITVAAGCDAVCEAAALPVDWTMAAIVGVAGLKPTLRAIEAGRTLAFASKECLVCAGALMIDACRKHGATLLPVDSEHNAIFQVFDFEQPQQIAKIVLTASGGPFRYFTPEQLQTVTPKQAVAHPNWDMGAKISVDSATMMNKALEMIEAYHLFPVAADQIEAIIHPQSVVHSLVYYRDGSVLAQLGQPDMRIPIAHTLGWPKRLNTTNPALSLADIGQLNFEAPDWARFPALKLVRSVLDSEQSLSVAFNAANEVAVSAFLQKQIAFTQIVSLVEQALEKTANVPVKSIEDALYIDDETRQMVLAAIASESN